MITTLLMTCLAATEVNSVDAAAQPTVVEQPGWSVQLAVAAPSVVAASFSFDAPGGALGGLGGLLVTQPRFGNALTVERAFGPHWSGIASVSFSASSGPGWSFVNGGGLVGARWYASRTLEGLFVGPEVMAYGSQVTFMATSITNVPLTSVGAGARAGWAQRFGAHFIASASAGLNGSVMWRPQTPSLGATQATLNLGLDVMLSAGLVF